jgi:hypothetical protein
VPRTGLIGVLGTYQQTLSGPTANHTSVVPVGLRPGKVFLLDGGYTLNAYIEAQPSLYRTGLGAPNFQVFTGISLQLPPSFSSGWHIF